MKIVAVDLFCGVGGLTHGVLSTGIEVVAGIDIDKSCKYAFESNNKSLFIHKNVEDLTVDEIHSLFPKDSIRVLMGCAPCQPFSTYTYRYKEKKENDSKWKLLYSFERLIKEIKPEIISMENVPELAKKDIFNDFIKSLYDTGYYVEWDIVFCPNYGIPQNRKRLVLLASRLGPISIIEPFHDQQNYITVGDVIKDLPAINAGESCDKDQLHTCSSLSETNLKRIRQSVPGGTWRDWDEDLILDCHKKESGKSYPSVYGRMEWDKPSPTITTQFYGYGNGRFGHPEQDRALSLREGALLQTFPLEYKFIEPGQKVFIKQIGTHIGNAVPVKLAAVFYISIVP